MRHLDLGTHYNRSSHAATFHDPLTRLSEQLIRSFDLSLDDAWAPACLLALCGWRCAKSFLLRKLMFVPAILLCLYNNAFVAAVCLWVVSSVPVPSERNHCDTMDDFATSSSDDDDDECDMHDSIAARVKARHARKRARAACVQVQVQLNLPEGSIANFTSSPPRRTGRITRSLTRRSVRMARKSAPSRRARGG